jgi:hypothetical protein
VSNQFHGDAMLVLIGRRFLYCLAALRSARQELLA